MSRTQQPDDLLPLPHLPLHVLLALSAEESQARTRLEEIFREAKLTPPDATGVASLLADASPEVVERMLRLLQRDGRIVKVDALLFHADALAGLKRDVIALKAEAAGPVRIDVGAFKERFGVSRKYAIPLLGYLDRERVTRRVGGDRVVL